MLSKNYYFQRILQFFFFRKFRFCGKFFKNQIFAEKLIFARKQLQNAHALMKRSNQERPSGYYQKLPLVYRFCGTLFFVKNFINNGYWPKLEPTVVNIQSVVEKYIDFQGMTKTVHWYIDYSQIFLSNCLAALLIKSVAIVIKGVLFSTTPLGSILTSSLSIFCFLLSF